MSLRIRLTVVVTTTVAAAVLIGAYAAYASTSGQLRAEMDDFLLGRAEGFTFDVPAGSDHGLTGGLVIGEDRDVPGAVDLDAVSQIITADGSIETSIPGQPRLPVDAADADIAEQGGLPRLRDITIDGVPYRMVTAPASSGRAVQIARSAAENDAVLAGLRSRLVLIALVGTLLAALAAYAVARRTTKPIEALTRAAEDVATTQDLKHPIAVATTDEVGRLATSFNTMLAALDTSREQQQRLVTDASHELRTPLTAVRTNIDVLERAEDLTHAQRQHLLGEVRVELSELTELISELVELATDARTAEAVESVDLNEIASTVAARFQRRSGRTVNVQASGDSTVQGRPSMIDRAVANLVDNALKFSPASTSVEVVVEGASIEVLDRGPGLDAADHDRVFDRFYRAESARTEPGSGLGLAIVQRVAEVHNGSAAVSDRDGGGLIARIDFAASCVDGQRRV